MLFCTRTHRSEYTTAIMLPIIRGLCQGRFLPRNGFMLWTRQPSTVVMWRNSEFSGVCTYVRMYACMRSEYNGMCRDDY